MPSFVGLVSADSPYRGETVATLLKARSHCEICASSGAPQASQHTIDQEALLGKDGTNVLAQAAKLAPSKGDSENVCEDSTACICGEACICGKGVLLFEREKQVSVGGRSVGGWGEIWPPRAVEAMGGAQR